MLYESKRGSLSVLRHKVVISKVLNICGPYEVLEDGLYHGVTDKMRIIRA